jgi:4'-phosphopantetheinyl transferase
VVSGATPVDVWTIRLDAEPFAVCDDESMLDGDERARASRFVFARDRRRFVRRRIALRTILGSLCGLPPDRLRFGKGLCGKPFLRAPGDGSITFSASHSHELALVAVTRGCCLGVDVEWSGRTIDWRSVSSMFAEHERARLRQLSGRALDLAGYRCWTRKEAFVKARGEGLSLPLPLFEVSVEADEPARLLRIAPEIDDGLQWTLTDIDAPPGYVAVLATAFGQPSLRVHDAMNAFAAAT